MGELPKSELAVKRDEWFESSEGKRCLNLATLRVNIRVNSTSFLKNRLEAAFLAGAKANHEVEEEIAEKLLNLIV